MNYWILKSEPDVFSIDDLKARPGKTEPWDGIRNYQARNFIRDGMQPGDLAFFYHSSCGTPGIAGIVKITGKPRPDPTAFDRRSEYYDGGSTPDNPRWYLVDVRFKRKLRRVIPLAELKPHPALKDLKLLQRGNRLSVMPVTREEWDYILSLE